MKKNILILLTLCGLEQLHGFALFKNNSQSTVRIAVDYPMNESKSCPDETFELKPNGSHRSPPKGEGCLTSKIIFTILGKTEQPDIEITGNYNNHEFEITDKGIKVKKENSTTIKKKIPFKNGK